MEKKVTVIVGPFIQLLRSRKVMISLSALIVAVIVALVPELASVEAEMIVMVFAVAGVLIGGVAAEDMAKVKADATVKAGQTDEALIRDVVTSVLDEMLAKRGGG